MDNAKHSPVLSTHRFSLPQLLVIGAMLGLAVILFFIVPAIRQPNPAWSNYWILQPLSVTPLAGAMAGVWYYMMDYLRVRGGWKALLANVLTVVGCFVAIWLGVVLGLIGTMWD